MRTSAQIETSFTGALPNVNRTSVLWKCFLVSCCSTFHVCSRPAIRCYRTRHVGLLESNITCIRFYPSFFLFGVSCILYDFDYSYLYLCHIILKNSFIFNEVSCSAFPLCPNTKCHLLTEWFYGILHLFLENSPCPTLAGTYRSRRILTKKSVLISTWY